MNTCSCDGRYPGCEHSLPCPGGPLYKENGGLCPDCAEQDFQEASKRFIGGLVRHTGGQVEVFRADG